MASNVQRNVTSVSGPCSVCGLSNGCVEIVAKVVAAGSSTAPTAPVRLCKACVQELREAG